MYQPELRRTPVANRAFRSNNPHMTKKTEKNVVGPVIDARLRELKKTQKWLAHECGVTEPTVSLWIKNGQITRTNLAAVGLALGLSASKLMGDQQRELPIEKEAPKPALHYILPDEAELLEDYRLSTDEGKRMARSFLKVAPKKADEEPVMGRYHHAA